MSRVCASAVGWGGRRLVAALRSRLPSATPKATRRARPKAPTPAARLQHTTQMPMHNAAHTVRHSPCGVVPAPEADAICWAAAVRSVTARMQLLTPTPKLLVGADRIASAHHRPACILCLSLLCRSCALFASGLPRAVSDGYRDEAADPSKALSKG